MTAWSVTPSRIGMSTSRRSKSKLALAGTNLAGMSPPGGGAFSFCAPTIAGADVASRASVIVVKALSRIVILTVLSKTVVARFLG